MSSDSSATPSGSEPGPATSAPEADAADHPPVIPDTLPILPTRGVAVFPGIVGSLSIGRPPSRKLLEVSLPQSKIIGLFAQKNPEQEHPGPDDLYHVGVACAVHKLVRQPDDSGVMVVVSALERIAIRKILSTEPFIRAEIEVLQAAPTPPDDKPWQATLQQLRESALELIALVPDAPPQAGLLVRTVERPDLLADLIANSLSLDTALRSLDDARARRGRGGDVDRRVRAGGRNTGGGAPARRGDGQSGGGAGCAC